jgi:hypothetical protein
MPGQGQAANAHRRRRRRFATIGAGALVVALVITVVTWLLSGPADKSPDRSALDQAPFAGAVAALASAPEVHYRTIAADLGTVDIRATATGELIGTAEQDGQPLQLLRAGGRVYVKPPDIGMPGVTNPAQAAAMNGKWLTGSSVVALLGSLSDRFVPPQRLASLLAGALSTAEPLDPTTIDGQLVAAANTRLGTLYVTQNQPYRVVRLAPAASFGPTGHPAAYFPAQTADTTGSSGIDFPPEQPQDVYKTYDRLRSAAGELASAIDTDLNFNLQGNGQISCSGAGCQVTVTVSNAVNSSTSGARVTGGNVTAELTADVIVDDQPAGGCTSAGPLPLNGTGTMSCSAASAAGVFTATEARKKAQAEQQSQAEGGAPVPYNISFSGEYYVYATAQVDVEELVQQVGKDADDAVKLYKAPAKGLTQKLLKNGFHEEDFPGDPRREDYPDGRAYFGLHELGKDIALDYAGRGGYDSNLIEVTIPLGDFERYFGKDVRSYDGVPNAQVGIPNTSFDILNRYPRTLVP